MDTRFIASCSNKICNYSPTHQLVTKLRLVTHLRGKLCLRLIETEFLEQSRYQTEFGNELSLVRSG